MRDINHTNELMSIPRAADLFGVSRTTMWKWVKSGEIEAIVTPGGHHRISRETIDRFLQKCRTESRLDPATPKKILLVDDDLAMPEWSIPGVSLIPIA